MNDEQKFKKLLDGWARRTARYNMLKEQVEKLENLNSFPIFAISAFILKCQLIESELPQFIFYMDCYLHFMDRQHLIYKKVRYPKALLDNPKCTLGALITKLKEYQGNDLDQLLVKLEKLRKLRNDFTHKLYWSDKPVPKLIEETEDGLKLADEVLELLNGIAEKFQKDL